MRILLVHPGAAFATSEVWQGYADGLRDEGHVVFEYETASRAQSASVGLKWLHEVAKTGSKPTRADVLYAAGHAVYSMVLRHAIEAVVIITAEHWHPDHTILLRRAGMRVAIVVTESPYQDEKDAVNLSLASVVLTNERSSVARLSEAFELMESPTRAHYLPVAYNALVHKPGRAKTGAPHDVVFVGSAFNERIALLEAVDWRGINLGLYGNWALAAPKLVRRFLLTEVPAPALIAALRLLPGASPLWRHVRGGIISNRRAVDLYRRAAIGLNLSRSSVAYSRQQTLSPPAESIGPRLYELAACGVFTISEYRPEVADIFGDLVPTFETPEELGELVRYWLDRPGERGEIAALLPAAVARHSYRHRARALVQHLEILNVRS